MTLNAFCYCLIAAGIIGNACMLTGAFTRRHAFAMIGMVLVLAFLTGFIWLALPAL